MCTASSFVVPHHVVTQGIGTILEARHLVLIATGTSKADSIVRAVEGAITSICPGSAIQLHPHTTVVIDAAAASQLTRGRPSDLRSVSPERPATTSVRVQIL